MRRVIDEITAAPKKTVAEILLSLPIALLPVEPYREWITQFRYVWYVYLVLVVVRVVYNVWRRMNDRRNVAARITRATELLQVIIECSRAHTKEGADGEEPTKEHLQHSIALVLQSLADLTAQILQPPEGVKIYANLMIAMPVPVKGHEDPQHGLGIVAYGSKRPAEPAWTRLMVEDFGAGETFRSGKVQVIEDTGDPKWCGIFSGVRSKCFASFPVVQSYGKPVAVVNIDADRPLVLTRRNAVNELFPAIAGALNLLADILYHTREKKAPQSPGARGRNRHA
jgi:hypothetical protein